LLSATCGIRVELRTQAISLTTCDPYVQPSQAHTSGRLKVASLFSGCGVLDYGLTQAGHEIILQTEANPVAREVLAARFQGICQPRDPAMIEVLPSETAGPGGR
jgi:hypothetical protein